MLRAGAEPRTISYAWVVLGTSFLTLFTVLSLRSGFGLFFAPVESELGWSRTELSLAVTINMLVYGAFQPISGRLADRYGPKLVIMLGVLGTGLGLAILGLTSELWHFYLGYGVLLGATLSFAGFVGQAALISRWFVEKRQLALGIAFAGAALGQFIMVPLTLYLIVNTSWRGALLALGLGLVVLITPMIGALVRDGPASDQTLEQVRSDLGVSDALRTRPFWLLSSAFFVCGLSITMVTIHLPSHLAELGYEQSLGAAMLGVMGLLSAIGCLLVGVLSSRIPPRTLLGSVYICRALAVVLLVRASSPLDLWIFTIVFGFSWLATVPLTSGLTATTYGRTALATIYGFVSSVHQLGDALGVLLAGYLFDLTGSYRLPFSGVVVMLLLAGSISFLIDGRPRRLAREAVPAAT